MIFGLEGLAAGMLALSAVSGGGQAITCKAAALPPVRVEPSKSVIQYDHSLTQGQLDRMEIDTVNPYGDHKQTHVGGLMSGEITVEHQIGFVQERYDRLGVSCLYYDSVDVKININPTIYIARENKPGSCRYNAILEHEKKHVEVDRLVVNKYARRIGESVSFALKQYGSSFGPFPVGEIAYAQERLQEYLGGVIKAEVDAMNEERRASQQAIDTIQEYERVRRLCP